jgi:membrane protein implicated in regulation of membrane protease activity
MPWWLWVVVGFLLIGLELAVAGNFFVIFFGAGALIVGLLGLVGLSGPQWLQWLLFSCFSVISLLLFRDPLLRRLGGLRTAGIEIDAIPGEHGHAMADIGAGATGQVELRGATWSAQNVGADALQRGDRCRVVRLDGLTLSVVRDPSE